MDKQYKNLMEKQNVAEEINAEFYEKLNKTEKRRKSITWKVAAAAACLALMIPATVFAVENLFHVPEAKLGDTVHFTNMNGYMVRFEGMDSYPLDAFSKEVQTVTEFKNVRYDSWAVAEETLGIDLLNNTVLDNATKDFADYDDTGRTHCYVGYRPYEGKLFYLHTLANYRYDGLQLNLNAKLTVEHPAMTEEDKLALLGVEGAVTKPENVETTYENYTTKEGIPVVILRWDFEIFDRYMAVFAVNDITYELSAFPLNEKSEAAAQQILKDVLDGFELN